MNIHDLQPGTPCYVEMRLRLYPGVVVEQCPNDRWVRVASDAAKVIRHYWQTMAIRWRDGLAVGGYGDGRLIVAKDEAETAVLNARVTADAEARRRGIALQRMPASPQGQFWWLEK